MPTLPSLPSDLSSLNGTYPDFEGTGGTLTVNVTPTTIDQFVHGQAVQPGLLGGTRVASTFVDDESHNSDLLVWGCPTSPAEEIDATFGIHATLQYDVGFGLDGHGFWIRAGNASDPTLGLSFGVTAGLQGQVEVFGFPLADAGGDIGFSVTPYVTLTAPPWAADPDQGLHE